MKNISDPKTWGESQIDVQDWEKKLRALGEIYQDGDYEEIIAEIKDKFSSLQQKIESLPYLKDMYVARFRKEVLNLFNESK